MPSGRFGEPWSVEGPRVGLVSALPITTPVGAAPWYRQAVFYEVVVRAFQDSTGDGTGDLRGLISKLDYLQWLGVDCLWLLPFYDSPLRDGGYDIADFFSVHPSYGTTEDARELVEEAHRRGMRVIADLIMNHTSDQNAWFQESRQGRDNPKSDWYVWSDDDQRWPDVRVIFCDDEPSNWSWDSQREQFYWHRFFHHQPDLNYDNPEVCEAMLGVVRHWLDVGFDGFRLDAVPYLYERDFTNGESLPETHAFLKRVRREVDASHPGKVLLAEANQPPSETVAYFGDGDECHMNFHFPLMPRLFLAVRQGKRQPVADILAETPPIPGDCQWGIFLRNHDELTLAMVTDDEREFMFAEYSPDARMRRNVGIARRLFPLVENDRRVAELLHALLLSLPGSPILYYGDELGMGDNIHLFDRDAVRTPMQWTPDRSGGFSSADYSELALPANVDPVYGYQAVNVESQQRDPSSFLHWVRTMLSVRRSVPVFGVGSLEVLDIENDAVLGFMRSSEEDLDADGHTDLVLCVNNMSAKAQPVEMDLSRFAGKIPMEMTGRVAFPPIGELPYFVTLAPYGFFWFTLIDPTLTR